MGQEIWAKYINKPFTDEEDEYVVSIEIQELDETILWMADTEQINLATNGLKETTEDLLYCTEFNEEEGSDIWNIFAERIESLLGKDEQ